MTPDFKILWNKPLLVDYVSAIWPDDVKKFKRMSCRQLKAIIIRKSKEAVNEVS